MRAGKLYIVMLLTTLACFGQDTGNSSTTPPLTGSWTPAPTIGTSSTIPPLTGSWTPAPTIGTSSTIPPLTVSWTPAPTIARVSTSTLTVTTIIHEGRPRPNPTAPVSSDQTAVGEKTETCPDCALGSWLWILQTVYITVLILLFSSVQIYTRTCRNTGSADLDYENTRPSHPAAETELC